MMIIADLSCDIDNSNNWKLIWTKFNVQYDINMSLRLYEELNAVKSIIIMLYEYNLYEKDDPIDDISESLLKEIKGYFVDNNLIECGVFDSVSDVMSLIELLKRVV